MATTHAPAPDELRARFERALQEKNFGERCHQLAAIGKGIRAAGPAPEALEVTLDGLVSISEAAEGDASAFAERCRLIVAKAAGCSRYAKKLLSHPSKTVRFEAARGGLLSAEDAREAFLSADSSQALKKVLVGCKALPCDKAVLDHAWQLFGAKDKQNVWEIMARATDEELLKSWLTSFTGMSEWLNDRRKNPPHLPQIALRFPAVMVELVRQGDINWSWHWLKDVLHSSPSLVLQAAFLEGNLTGSGPLKAYIPTEKRQDLVSTMASWGWRHRPDIMLELCRELAVRESGGRKGAVGVPQMAELMMKVTSTRYYITTSQKIAYLSSIWSQVPTSWKTPQRALQFVKLLPSGLQEHRVAELKKVVETFWKIVADVGRTARRELLVGQEAKPEITDTLEAFARRLPPPIAVEQFFRTVEEFEAATPAYKFIQSTVCKSKDGRHDMLALRVFERYLQKEGVAAVQTTSMFQALLEAARSRDIVQKAFGSLMSLLGGKMELGLMLQVVTRMLLLERESIAKATAENTPAATLPVPVHWASLVKLPEDCSPMVDFLLHVLHSGTGETELLGAMLKKYGPCFFWDCLGSVLRAATKPKPQRLLQEEPPPADLELLRKVDLSSVGRPLARRVTSGALQPSDEVGAATSIYFAALEETKRKTLGKDAAAREAGYKELMALAQKDVDPAKAFADLLPFVVGRFKGEQNGVRGCILGHLLEKEMLPVKLWEDNLAHLQSLWKVFTKMRDTDGFCDTTAWQHAGRILVEKALREWGDSSEPCAACAFGVEVAEDLNLPSVFVDVQKHQCKEGESLSDAAARWVFVTSVPLADDGKPAIERFWDCLTVMAKIVPKDKGKERALWDRWPFVSEHWRAIFAEGLSQKAMQFAMVGVVELLTLKASSLAIADEGKRAVPWWAPLDCAEYQAAISSILAQMESGEIPAKEASSMIAKRVHALIMKEARSCEGDGSKGANWKVRGRRRRPRREELEQRHVDLRAAGWVKDLLWDVPKHQRYIPLPFNTYRCRDSVATQELAALSSLLASRRDHRCVLWQIAEAAAELSGPHMQKLLEDAICTIDARFEGMARAIGRHYPYLNAALSKGEKQDGCSDVLTPLVELWLFDDPTRDDCAARIMERGDFQYFLFFGTSFARHLSNRRQEWLHRCLDRLQEPSAQPEPEFYSRPRRGPELVSVAQLGAGWRAAFARAEWTLAPGAMGQQGPPSVQMYLWHPDTQAAFAQKALFANNLTSLLLLPRLEFANGVAEAKQRLQRYPQEQTVKPAGKDLFGWEVIQAAAAYTDISTEVERRFLEQPAPWVCDAMSDREAEALLSALGRADLAEPALKVLGGFSTASNKFRNAKMAVTKLMRQVSPAKARGLIKEVMMPRKAGVGLQTAGLRMIVELQIPEPLELYKAAWSNGKCPRDVAGIILAKVNESQSFSPEDVRGFFDFFKDMAGQQDECIYVAGLLLDQLADVKEWSLPFLPEVVAELAMLPGMTTKAVNALKSSSSNVTEVVRALTKVLSASRLAKRMAAPEKGSDQSGPEAQVLADLTKLSASSNVRDLARCTTQMKLRACDPAALLQFVDELMRRWQDEARLPQTPSNGSNLSSLLECVLSVWVELLRAGHQGTWQEVLSSMEERLARQGKPSDLAALAVAVTLHVPNMDLSTEEHEAMLATAGDFLERLLDQHLANKAPAVRGHADQAFEKQSKDRSSVAKEVLKHWAILLARGCTEKESQRLFARCPDESRLDLASTIVEAATKESKKQQQALKRWRQKRPDEGWTHEGGIPAEEVKVGSVVDGTVTNSSATHGVFFNFGCVRDGKLNCPEADWKKYKVGDEVKGMIVNKVDIKPQQAFIELILMRQDGTSAQGQFISWEVACRAVQWLSTPAGSRSLHFSTLAGLWASVAALNCGQLSFETLLVMLGPDPPVASDGVRLVKELLDAKTRPEKALMRQALSWLGRVQPEEAVRLWPALFTETDPAGGRAEEVVEAAEAGDVQALLALCEEHTLEPPEFPAIVARGLSDTVLGLFCASSIPEARLVVVQALWERHLKLEEMPEHLRTLAQDSCEVVAMAARRLLASLEPEKAFKAAGDKGECSSDGASDDDESCGSEDS